MSIPSSSKFLNVRCKQFARGVRFQSSFFVWELQFFVSGTMSYFSCSADLLLIANSKLRLTRKNISVNRRHNTTQAVNCNCRKIFQLIISKKYFFTQNSRKNALHQQLSIISISMRKKELWLYFPETRMKERHATEWSLELFLCVVRGLILP